MPPATAGHKCPIVLACDERYAMPLATTLRSLVEANTRHWPLDVTVLTDGLAEETKVRVGDSLPAGSVSLSWRLIDVSRFAGFSLMPHVSRMSFARFDIERAFGPDVMRVLYLDTDILVLGDLGPLFEMDLGDHVLAAVADDHIDGTIRAKGGHGLAGVPNVARYFNAGVLLINLDSWRRYGTGRSAMEYMVKFPNSPYSDQDGMNVACDNEWAMLDRRWNYQQHRPLRISSLAPGERPAVVHFITEKKPWLPSSMSLNADLYDSFRDRTRFRRSPHSRVRDALMTLAYRILRKVRTVAGRGNAV